jgi:rhodanese-related sulfurtransferase
MTTRQGPDARQRVAAARRQIRELDTAAIKILLAFGTQLIDLRDSAAFAAAPIPGARRVDREVLVAQAASLQNLGSKAVVSLRGGLRQWSGPLEGESQAVA